MTKSTSLIFLLIIAITPLFAQQDRSVVTLTKDPAGLFKSYKFFIQNVEDQRPQPGASLGKVIALGKEIPAVLAGKAESELFSYWSYLAPKKGIHPTNPSTPAFCNLLTLCHENRHRTNAPALRSVAHRRH